MTSPSPEIRWVKPQQSRSQETMERLRVAGEDLLNEKPFQQVSVEEIATAAGSSVGGFYARFADKEALFDYIYECYQEEKRETTAQMLAPERWQGVSLEKRVHAAIEFLFNVACEHRGLMREVMLRLPSEPRTEHLVEAENRGRFSGSVRDLLLECVGEMRHPDPILATRIGLFSIISSVKQRALFTKSATTQSIMMADEVFIHELAVAFLAYVRALPPDQGLPESTSTTKGLSHAEHP